MTLGMILLIAASVLILLGAGQRVLDRMRLNDKTALLFIALIIAFGFVPEIRITQAFAFNIGGFVIPLALCVYLLYRADTAAERVRSIAASIVTGLIIFLIGRLAPDEPEAMRFDPILLYGAAAGAVACLLGRSRRCAFIAGTIGMMLANIANAVLVWTNGIAQPLILGGAGAFDAIVLSGLIAVLLAELAGELFERIRRGTQRPTREFKNGEFVKEERK